MVYQQAHKAHKAINFFFSSPKNKCQNNLKLIKDSGFVFDFVYLLYYECHVLYYECHKINLNCVGSYIESADGKKAKKQQ